MEKVLVIVGPTAVGKTSFGIKCANSFDGEIISGDSIQIYKGLDIGSGKASKEELASAVHHLIDIKEADESYSVKEFQSLCREYIDDISKRNKLPIIVGGTGLYIKASLYDYKFMDEEVEDYDYPELSNEQLYEKLKQIDPKALEKIHVNNRRRLLRAINIYEKHNQSMSEIKDEQEHKPIYDCLIIGLTDERDKIYSNISKRVDKMVEDGLIDEIKTLLDKGIGFDNQCMKAIGYKEFEEYFKGSKTLEECVEMVKTNSRRFAKRQYTFFNNQLNVEWYTDTKQALKRIEEWI